MLDGQRLSILSSSGSVLFAVVLLGLAGCGERKQARKIGTEKMRKLLLESCTTPYHKMILPDEHIALERIEPPPEIKRHRLYRVHLIEADDMLIVATGPKAVEALILTDSISSYGQLLEREGVRVESVQEAERWVRHSLTMTRVWHSKFLLLESFSDIPYASEDEEQRRAEKARYGNLLRPLKVSRGPDGSYVATAYVLVARQLIRRRIHVTRGPGFCHEDEIIGDGIGSVADLHEK